jgi:hypothetical protein
MSLVERCLYMNPSAKAKNLVGPMNVGKGQPHVYGKSGETT